MTKEEIEAARELILFHLEGYEQASIKALDALCKAARPPQSLVGRRVRTIMGYIGTVKAHGWMVDVGRGETLFHQDGQFEPLEDADA